MIYYVVIDTNVFISALLSKRADAATVRVLDAMFDVFVRDASLKAPDWLRRFCLRFATESFTVIIGIW